MLHNQTSNDIPPAEGRVGAGGGVEEERNDETTGKLTSTALCKLCQALVLPPRPLFYPLTWCLQLFKQLLISLSGPSSYQQVTSTGVVIILPGNLTYGQLKKAA